MDDIENWKQPEGESCQSAFNKIKCETDATCRSALSNMYGCSSCNYCSSLQDSDPGLAWTSSGEAAIQCYAGDEVQCKNGRCNMAVPMSTQEFVSPDYEEAGVL